MPAETPTTPRTTPETRGAATWQDLAAGNARLVADSLEQPRRDPQTRAHVAEGQQPQAAVLACADSRVAPEVVLDQGLGDLFVVRTAGQVVDEVAVGSLEFGVDALGADLLLVLGHRSCGAVKAAIGVHAGAERPGSALGSVVDGVLPSVAAVASASDEGDAGGAREISPAAVEEEHVRRLCAHLLERSAPLAAAVAEGRLAVVGGVYDLADGSVTVLADPQGVTG